MTASGGILCAMVVVHRQIVELVTAAEAPLEQLAAAHLMRQADTVAYAVIMAVPLLELDSLEILVIIDNELDPISPSPNPEVQQTGGMREISALATLEPNVRGPTACNELRMSNICCSAHGLSLLITGIRGEKRHTLLFDTGPEESAFERNARRLHADLAAVEHVHLSHWHRDHSGGMLKAIPMVLEAKEQRHAGGEEAAPGLVVDLHPDRPAFRGVMSVQPVSLEADPTFEAISKAGAQVKLESQAHAVLENMFLVSGEIPRVTEYEKGLNRGIRFLADRQEWVEDTLIKDERYVMCHVKGVVNASRDAVQNGNGVPLYAVMGGYHLADAGPELIGRTIADLAALDAKVLLAGHCTGWRAKFAIQQHLPGRLVPSFVGNKFVLCDGIESA
nr:7,8-dihydropterin-6-methyl-4-(beta-d-ribofuranosyl)-aminobenzene-5'-phosphate synthase [Quercus suber]